ncbi:hypothetical protein BCR35DRAFT_335862 [Leucosporidium creatinivorum]|uniref:Uncharacterized protein n=1 Tax=Leucosporidium creatinivorum TaxID=106004 RepID=A0A1Y2D474_9BASI|nr:hypothetical protein BCR35DRAFT_335862 [Leucosporidium creatinivorum]
MHLTLSSDSNPSSTAVIASNVSPSKRFYAKQVGRPALALSDLLEMSKNNRSVFAAIMLTKEVNETNVALLDWVLLQSKINPKSNTVQSTTALSQKADHYLALRAKRWKTLADWKLLLKEGMVASSSGWTTSSSMLPGSSKRLHKPPNEPSRLAP